MQIRLLTIQQFFEAFPTAATPYASESFILLNADKADAVRCFAGVDDHDHPRLGIILGWDADGQRWRCPFSAPFGEVAACQQESIERIHDFFSELQHTLSPHPIEITLAPSFYDPAMLPKVSGVLSALAQRTVWDYDFYFPAMRLDNYPDCLQHSARKNLARALKAGFVFEPADLPRAYKVIQANRQSRGYRLAMTLDQVLATAQLVKVDSFVLALDGQDVAAAIVYRVTADIAQVIYWGDTPGYCEKRPMNMLAREVFTHYIINEQMAIVDVGPSSTNGIPNSGLCAFKESIGCMVALKPTFHLLSD